MCVRAAGVSAPRRSPGPFAELSPARRSTSGRNGGRRRSRRARGEWEKERRRLAIAGVGGILRKRSSESGRAAREELGARALFSYHRQDPPARLKRPTPAEGVIIISSSSQAH